ncbi:hypothetical protein NC652_017489 [Populus alba x Populus x berolinensis]|nr:hypothetical protein NC652_017472 [Populus alba x Populus x berolinensis]KAJ6924198.1 hypothetical protein NC652_017479 [Populus alba x Populus x berolinensis]KAJ6924209.1 hypothetical protein NC652_017489 [Populus alba x Populus x berolinensis]
MFSLHLESNRQLHSSIYKEQIFREELAKAKPPSATSLVIVKLESVVSTFFVYPVFTNFSDLTY